MFPKKMKVLCVSDYYLPGFKGGGPIRTIVNMCDALADDIEFWIYCRDRDLGDVSSYADIPIDQWIINEKHRVYYASPAQFGVNGLKRITATEKFDIIYLNSFFSYKASISLLLYFKYKSINSLNILIAPRGEFSTGALKIKALKKHVFIALAKLVGIYSNIYWHVSSPLEAEDVARMLPNAKERSYVAPDLVLMQESGAGAVATECKQKGEVRIAFISRVSPMKNLSELLTILGGLKCKVKLAIYGPIEDVAYWELCKNIVADLPTHIEAIYSGVLAPEDVSAAFANFDLFAFPTLGENFGHVIFESLRAGTPVMVSDQTPWASDSTGAITAISLNSVENWRQEIEKIADRTSEQQTYIRAATLEYAKRYIATSSARAANLSMFKSIT